MADNWYDDLGLEDEKLQLLAKKFDGPAAALKSLGEAESALGNWKANGVRIPGPDASDEDRRKAVEKLQQISDRVVIRPGEDATEEETKLYLRTLGVPEDLAGYTPAEDFEGLEGEQITQVAEVAGKLGLTRDQFRGLLDHFKGVVDTYKEGQANGKADREALLRRGFGDAFDDTNNVIKGMVDHFAHPDHAIELDGLDAPTMLLLERISREFVGKGRQAPFHRAGGGGISISEAREQAGEIRTRLMSDEVIPKEERQRLVQKMSKLDSLAARAQ